MLRTSESETEILLGNKQLLGIFFVVAILLGVAFAGGYMIGRGSNKKTPAIPAAAEETAAGTAPTASTGQTHDVTPADSSPSSEQSSTVQTQPAADTSQNAPAVVQPPSGEDAEPPLGSPKRGKAAGAHQAEAAPTAADATSHGGYTPESGQTFLQVAAVGRDEAEAVADVLHKKGFLAHAVPKPGSSKIYRVLIGPVRDAGDLSMTRDSLRKTGFREVIVQRY